MFSERYFFFGVVAYLQYLAHEYHDRNAENCFLYGHLSYVIDIDRHLVKSYFSVYKYGKMFVFFFLILFQIVVFFQAYVWKG
jgi:hypothetical protein